MLTIRSGQLEAFRRSFELALADRVFRSLHDDFPGSVAGLPEALVRRRIDRGLRRSRELGFETDLAAILFVAMMFAFGPTFDRHPVVAETLRPGDGPADERMLTVVLELPDRIWDELAILADRDWGDEGGSGGEAA